MLLHAKAYKNENIGKFEELRSETLKKNHRNVTIVIKDSESTELSLHRNNIECLVNELSNYHTSHNI